ncbi:hypothetical protein [Nocardioides zhouii]|uniref:Exo-alpha-sialidase n=1 Tax=Nocardioides zhouii TaxID=1168729 RepID=A0A4Q2T7B6_9ACTN|nr:hypothetical protein [Nocardioides zhouii]RYC14662.1 hypothetical protein EUA94_00640 [Nocardioides zhouii]
MSRYTGLVVALATAAAVMTVATVDATPPATFAVAATAELPRDIETGVELTLADGDLLRVWAEDSDGRRVWSRRRDAAAGVWGPRLLVLKTTKGQCDDVDARTANGAVAVLAHCDIGGMGDESTPTPDARALWSPDAVTWSAYELEGEAGEEPGISPDGLNAVWPMADGYVTHTAAGFAPHVLATPDRETGATATINDAALVSYLYGITSGDACSLVVLTRTGDGSPARQDLPLRSECWHTLIANIDADTAWVGDVHYPEGRAVVSRPDAGSPWSVTQIAPIDAPGLEDVSGVLSTDFFTAPGLPLVALGSRVGRQVRAQRYDPAAQAWGPVTTVHRSRTPCQWGNNLIETPLAVLAIVLQCGDSNVVLTTRDGLAWRALRMGERPVGNSPDGRYVAVPGPTSTHVISAELGVVSLPGGITGRCDVVVPDGPRAAVQLLAEAGSRRWPTLLRRVSATGTKRLGRYAARTTGRCSEAEPGYYLPLHFDMRSTRIDLGQAVRIVRRDSGWTVRIKRF